MKSSKLPRSFLTILLVIALCFAAAAQQTNPVPSPSPQVQQPASQPQPLPPPKPKQEVPGAGIEVENAPEQTITPAEAKELLGMVDTILKFDSKDTALPIKHEVKRALASRDQVQRYLEDHMKSDKDTQRLQRSAVVLQKFGLLPPDFDLKDFLVQLLREQVAGYYDPKTKTVYLLNWLSPKTQLPVMAHELTHALQDQSFNLEKWLKDPENKNLQKEVESDEEAAARQAVVEGQAMVSLLDYMLAPSEQNVVNAPWLVEALRAGMSSAPDSPVLSRAPMFIREALTFPYNYGLNFEREVEVKRGKEAAFAGVFRNPPRSTREIMEPQTYLSGEKLPPLSVPDYDKLLGRDYKRFDVGSIGEFDVAVLLKQYARKKADKTLATEWRGGYYYAAKPKNDPKRLTLVFVTRWGTPQAAQQFADVYSSYVSKRYQQARPEEPAAARRWATEDGPVTIEVQGNTLLVMESLDDDAAAKVRDAVLGKLATVNQRDDQPPVAVILR